jgi:predicted nucleic acid-binding protein
MRQHVLDTNALHRYLFQGEGKEIVSDVLRSERDAGVPVLMSAVNWGALFYTTVKRIGLQDAESLLTNLDGKLGIAIVPASTERCVRAAMLKARYSIPYGDAFAAELTGTQKVLVTADIKDFQRVPKIRLLKLPRKKPN